MRSAKLFLLTTLFMILVSPQAAGQEAVPPDGALGGEAAAAELPDVWVRLADGRRLRADEVSESAGGYLFRRGNITTFFDRADVLGVEREAEAGGAEGVVADARATPSWRLSDSRRVEEFFAKAFGRPLPVTAYGQSDLHRRWNLDHRRSLDVGLHPDSPEGRALVRFLRESNIPFIAFRSAVPGAATAPHIHIGHPSPRRRSR